MMRQPKEEFINFLIEAKKQTYAAQGDDASVTPLLPGSKQLEYHKGFYSYRDVYYGLAFFAGQETVEYEGKPIWTMVYSGGPLDPSADKETVKAVYSFLRQALSLVDEETIYRGPRHYVDGDWEFRNEYEGGLERFRGREAIWARGVEVYALEYSGGCLM